MDHSIYSCGHTGLEMPKCGWRHMLMLRRMTYIALASRWSVRPMMITMPLGARAFRPPSSSTAAAGPVPPRQRRRHRRDIIGPTTLDHRGGISVRCSSPSSTAPDRRRDGGSLRVAGGSDGDAGEDDVLAATATMATTTATAARGGGGKNRHHRSIAGGKNGKCSSASRRPSIGGNSRTRTVPAGWTDRASWPEADCRATARNCSASWESRAAAMIPEVRYSYSPEIFAYPPPTLSSRGKSNKEC